MENVKSLKKSQKQNGSPIEPTINELRMPSMMQYTLEMQKNYEEAVKKLRKIFGITPYDPEHR